MGTRQPIRSYRTASHSERTCTATTLFTRCGYHRYPHQVNRVLGYDWMARSHPSVLCTYRVFLRFYDQNRVSNLLCFVVADVLEQISFYLEEQQTLFCLGFMASLLKRLDLVDGRERVTGTSRPNNSRMAACKCRM